MNGKLPSMFACFLPYRDFHQENMGKKWTENFAQRQ
jgi:hypothetical protein